MKKRWKMGDGQTGRWQIWVSCLTPVFRSPPVICLFLFALLEGTIEG
jgi:hypothetical protein